MIKRIIEVIIGPISYELFTEAAEEVTRDIRVNRLAFKKITGIGYTVLVMVIYIEMVRNQGLEKEKSPKLIA